MAFECPVAESSVLFWVRNSHFLGYHRAKGAGPPFLQSQVVPSEAARLLVRPTRSLSRTSTPSTCMGQETSFSFSLARLVRGLASLSRRPMSPESPARLDLELCVRFSEEDQVDKILITFLGGTKEHCGNTSPIDATRPRKLSSSLLPRAPRPSQLTKLLWAALNMLWLRLLTAQVSWRRGCSRAEPVAVVASGCSQIRPRFQPGDRPMTRSPTATASCALPRS